jgi:hypothetical protein
LLHFLNNATFICIICFPIFFFYFSLNIYVIIFEHVHV